MLKLIKKIDLIGNILDIVSIDQGKNNEYLFLDDNHRVYKFFLKDFMFSFSKQIWKNTFPHHKYSKAISCSNNGYVLMAKPNSKIISIHKIQDNQLLLITRLKWHKTGISVSRFSDDCKYFATGGEDGRIFVYNQSNYRISTFLPRRPDYISCIVFGKSSENICYASYDLTLIVYDIQTDSQIKMIKTPSVVEDALFFDNDKKIFYVCKSGETGVLDIFSGKNEYKINLEHWPTRIILSNDGLYVYIGTRDNFLYICYVKDNNVVYKINTLSKGIVCIKNYDNLLFICFANGGIHIIDKYYKINEFLELLNQGDFSGAKKLAQENNFLLKTLEIYTNVKNNTWKNILKKIPQLLQNEDIQGILEICAPYFEDIEKEEEIKKYINKKSFIQNFLKRFEEKNYTFAYEIANQNPCIKNLKEYKELENNFEQICNLSEYLIFENSFVAKQKIEKLLKPFENILEKKNIIIGIYNNWDKYFLAEKYAKEKDFINYFSLSEQSLFIKKTKTYQKMYFICEQMTQKVQDEILNKNFIKAKEYLNFLIKLPPFKDFAIKNQKYLENIDIFFTQCRTKNYIKCYEMLDKYPELGSLEEYTLIHDDIIKVFEEAKSFAQKGDTEEVYSRIQKFFGIKEWKNKIDIIMKIAYLYEMRNAFENEEEKIDWEKSIRQYISKFGNDDEIKNFCSLKKDFKNIIETMNDFDCIAENESDINHIQSIIIKQEINI
ncbi:hypothetical protein [Helicobacter sp. 13S00477-4]|uniref:hypothetical protein n=1 Tax=Helicobacter sp. 13S00477-4 TaxID=1905759 RepID=UPI000BA68657|nr:hypothetical protein [Helicobacter sp. 13S00477-4]PAF52657.1 hypothetical protein BKH44_00260 [Helicobacter sp. 13S00477-4]